MIAILMNMLLPMGAPPSRPLPQPTAPLAITMAPADQRILFSWPSQRCPDKRMLPDAPVRAFRRADGQISLIAASYVNWTMTGSSFDTLKTDCRSVFGPDDAGAGDQAWIEATYTPDGRTVGALLSREISDDKRPGNCIPAAGNSCWLGDIIAARSADMGQSYSKGPIVASLGNKRTPNGSRYGAFTTSNIVRGADGFYTLAFLESKGVVRGNCLLRSADPLDPASWRGWDGQGFTLAMGTPESAQRCATLNNLDQPVRSIAWIPAKKRWIAVLAASQPGNGAGFYFSESPDLRRWSGLKLIARASISGGPGNHQRRWIYPVILDPDSKSRNFDTIDHMDALLIYTDHSPSQGKGPDRKDLVAVKVHID